MSEQRIDATAKLKTVWLIDPDGCPMPIPVETHTGNGLLIPFQHSQGATVLLPTAIADGWTVMQSECTPEAWTAWEKEQRKTGKKLTRELMKMLPERVQAFYRNHPTLGEHATAPDAASKTAPKKRGVGGTAAEESI